MGIRSITLDFEGGMVVGQDGESQSTVTSALLREALSGGDVALHFLGPEQVADGAALGRVASELTGSGAGAAVCGVRDATGRVTAPLAAGTAGFAPVAAGSLVVTSQALRDIGWDRLGRDGFWANDLLSTLYRAGPILTSSEIVATGGGTPAQRLLTIARAGCRFDPDLPTVIVLSPPDATCALYFDRFRDSTGFNLRILPPVARGAALVWLSYASAVVVPREIAALVDDGTTARLAALGVPVYWFLDDDVFALAEEYPAFARYAFQGFDPLKRGVAGIVASTPALADALQRRFGLAAAPPVLPPMLASDWPIGEGTEAVAAVVGGAFRGVGLRDEVMPALQKVAPHIGIVAHDSLRPFLPAGTTRFLRFEGDFIAFLHQWKRFRPAILLHPPGQSSNMANKSDATVFVAHALGAVPVVADEPAFSRWTEETGVVVVPSGGWEDALGRAADPAFAALMRERLTSEIVRRRGIAADLLAILGRPAAVTPATRDLRLQRLFDAPELLPVIEGRRTILNRIRRSLWKRGLLRGDQPPRIAPR